MAVPKPLSRHVFQESGERGEGEGAIVAGESLVETTKCGPVEGKQRPDACSYLLRAERIADILRKIECFGNEVLLLRTH